jgi:hypothetical protein
MKGKEIDFRSEIDQIESSSGGRNTYKIWLHENFACEALARVVLQVQKDTVISTELASLTGLSTLASIWTKNSQECESREHLVVRLPPPAVLPAITV